MINAQFEASNTADWTIQITAVDEDNGDDIDFTGASIAFEARHPDNPCLNIKATTDNGLITINTTLIEVTFVKSGYMDTLCAGSYDVGCVYSINGSITPLLTGQVSVYDGIASL